MGYGAHGWQATDTPPHGMDRGGGWRNGDWWPEAPRVVRPAVARQAASAQVGEDAGQGGRRP